MPPKCSIVLFRVHRPKMAPKLPLLVYIGVQSIAEWYGHHARINVSICICSKNMCCFKNTLFRSMCYFQTVFSLFQFFGKNPYIEHSLIRQIPRWSSNPLFQNWISPKSWRDMTQTQITFKIQILYLSMFCILVFLEKTSYIEHSLIK